MQKKSKYISEPKSQHTELSIQLSLDGFSFCVSNTEKTDIAVFTSYQFENRMPTPELLLQQVQQLFNQDENLHHEFENISVIHQNNLATLVPNDFFDKTTLQNYLQYTVKTLKNDFFAYDDLDTVVCKNVYVPYVNINNYLFQHFGEFEYQHHATVLIDKILNDTQQDVDEKSFFVYVSPQTIDIVVSNQGQLILYNSFEVHSKEDFIYYILFVAEQLQMNPNDFPLIFLGNINEQSEYYMQTKPYIKNCRFIKTRTDFFRDSDIIPQANYLIIS